MMMMIRKSIKKIASNLFHHVFYNLSCALTMTKLVVSLSHRLYSYSMCKIFHTNWILQSFLWELREKKCIQWYPLITLLNFGIHAEFESFQLFLDVGQLLGKLSVFGFFLFFVDFRQWDSESTQKLTLTFHRIQKNLRSDSCVIKFHCVNTRSLFLQLYKSSSV